jgi:type I restriction enzyme, S subunit
MSKWPQRTLLEADLQIIDGDRGKNYPSKKDFFEDGFCLFLNAGNVTLRGFDFSDTIFIDEERDKLLRKGKLQRGDVILTTRGTVGNVAYYGNDVDFEHVRINSGMVIIRTVASQLDPRFVYFFLRTRLFANQVKALITGSAQPQLPIRDMVRISMPNPPICEQVKIVSIIGALDDKVENNRRMNETLEEMARAIFKSWFVDFDPVHAKAAGNAPAHMDADTAALFPSSFGDDGLPMGWGQSYISNFAFRVKDKFEKGQNWDAERLIDLGRMPSNSIALNEYGEGKELSTSINIFKKGDFLFGSIRPYFCKAGLAPFNGVTNSSVFIIRSCEIKNNAFLYALCSSEKIFNKSIQFSKGTKMPIISWGDFSKFECVDSTQIIRDKFNSITLPIFDKILNNVIENTTLAELRDTLLPKLMSGEIYVKDAECEVEAAI